jgi:hypothetical protein
MTAPIRIAYVIDPRFPGGTSAAVAAELRVVAGFGAVSVHAVESAMFQGRHIAPQLQAAFDDLAIEPVWNAPVIAGDIVLLHNPAFLKFQKALPTRILCRQLHVIAHENFERPGGHEGFDVAQTLTQIDRASLALEKVIAPISRVNRATIDSWLGARPGFRGWRVQPEDWFNICAFDLCPPTAAPADRRGRNACSARPDLTAGRPDRRCARADRREPNDAPGPADGHADRHAGNSADGLRLPAGAGGAPHRGRLPRRLHPRPCDGRAGRSACQRAAAADR